MKKRIFAACAAAAIATGLMVGSIGAYIEGGWPETCLEMNDMVEASEHGSGAVGIYQRAFGDQAEQACRNDHLADVQGAFSWAIPEAETTVRTETVVVNPDPIPHPPGIPEATGMISPVAAVQMAIPAYVFEGSGTQQIRLKNPDEGPWVYTLVGEFNDWIARAGAQKYDWYRPAGFTSSAKGFVVHNLVEVVLNVQPKAHALDWKVFIFSFEGIARSKAY